MEGPAQSLWPLDMTLQELLSPAPGNFALQLNDQGDRFLNVLGVQSHRETNTGLPVTNPRTEANGTMASPDSGPPKVRTETRDCLASKTPLQKLLDLQLTLEKVSGSFQAGKTQGNTTAHPYPTGIEGTFTATDDFVDVIRSLHHSPSQGTAHDFPSDRWTEAQSDQNSGSEPPECSLSDESMLLLILSCYVRLLQVYESLVASLYNHVEQLVPRASRPSSSRRDSSISSKPSTAQGSPIHVPILNIGQFNLSTSPSRNVGLLLYFTLEMFERIQEAIQLCASGPSPRDNAGMRSISRRNDLISRPGQAAFRGGGMDDIGRAPNGRTLRAVSTVFESILEGIKAREEYLTGSIHEAKDILNHNS